MKLTRYTCLLFSQGLFLYSFSSEPKDLADEKSRHIGIRFAQNNSFAVTLDTSNYNVMDKWLFLV